MQYRYVAPSSHFARNGVSLDFRVASLLKIQFACTTPSGELPRWGAKNVLLLKLITLPIGEGGPRQRRSGTLVNDALETIFFALFHTASPIQPLPLWDTSFHRKEGVSTRAPSLGRGCRAQRGGVGFLFGRRSRLLFTFPLGKGVVSRKAASSYHSLPPWGRGTASAALGCSRKRRT